MKTNKSDIIKEFNHDVDIEEIAIMLSILQESATNPELIAELKSEEEAQNAVNDKLKGF